jgi:hypothetical protein
MGHTRFIKQVITELGTGFSGVLQTTVMAEVIPESCQQNDWPRVRRPDPISREGKEFSRRNGHIGSGAYVTS